MTTSETPIVVEEPVAVKALQDATDQQRNGINVPHMDLTGVFEQLNASMMGAVTALGARLEANQAEERARLYARWEEEDAWRRKQEAETAAIQERVRELIHATPEGAKLEAETRLRLRQEEQRKANDPNRLKAQLMAEVQVQIYVDDPDLVRQGINLNGVLHYPLRLGMNTVPKSIADNFRTLMNNRTILAELHQGFNAAGKSNGFKSPRDGGNAFNRFVRDTVEKYGGRADNPTSTIEVVSALPIFRHV